MLEKILDILNANSGAITVIVTTVLVGITAYYAIITHQILNETQKGRKIQSIDKKLERLCYPFLDTIKTFRNNMQSIDGDIAEIGDVRVKSADTCKDRDVFKIWHIIIEKYFYFRQDLEKIIPFLHLDVKIEEMFYRPIEGIADSLYVKDFKDWKNLDSQQKCKEINEIRGKVDFGNLHNNMRANLDSIILQTSEIIRIEKRKRSEL